MCPPPQKKITTPFSNLKKMKPNEIGSLSSISKRLHHAVNTTFGWTWVGLECFSHSVPDAAVHHQPHIKNHSEVGREKA